MYDSHGDYGYTAQQAYAALSAGTGLGFAGLAAGLAIAAT